MIKNLNDTTIPELYSRGLYDNASTDIAPEHMTKVLDTIFTGTAILLRNAKSMEEPTTYVYTRFDDKFVAACTVEYFENEDKNNPGNWALTWTFNESDIPSKAHRIEFSRPDTHSYIVSYAGEKYGFRYSDDRALMDSIIYALTSIKKWLDENAKAGEEVGVECEGLFQARVSIENGEKVFAIEADGEIKNLIKDDAAIEKK